MDWIREHWIWLVVLAGLVLVYIHMRTRRSRPGCVELTGVACALDGTPADASSASRTSSADAGRQEQ